MKKMNYYYIAGGIFITLLLFLGVRDGGWLRGYLNVTDRVTSSNIANYVKLETTSTGTSTTTDVVVKITDIQTDTTKKITSANIKLPTTTFLGVTSVSNAKFIKGTTYTDTYSTGVTDVWVPVPNTTNPIILTFTGVTRGQAFTIPSISFGYKDLALDTTPISTANSALTITPPTVIVPPSSALSVTPTDTKMTITWVPIAGVTAYTLIYGTCTASADGGAPTVNDPKTTLISTTTPNPFVSPTTTNNFWSYIFNKPSGSTSSYCFQLKYTNPAGDSPPSNWTTPQTFAALTVAPPTGTLIDKTTSGLEKQFTFEWNKIAGIDAYTLQYQICDSSAWFEANTFISVNIEQPTTTATATDTKVTTTINPTTPTLDPSKKYCIRLYTKKGETLSTTFLSLDGIYPDTKKPSITLEDAGTSSYQMKMKIIDAGGIDVTTSSINLNNPTPTTTTATTDKLTKSTTETDIYYSPRLDEWGTPKVYAQCTDLTKTIKVKDTAGNEATATFIFGNFNQSNTIDTGDLASATHFYYFNLIHACSGTTPTAANTPNPLTQTLLAFAHFLNISTIDLFS